MNALRLIKIGSNKLKSKKINSHRIDAEILLSKVLQTKREKILINLERIIEKKKISEFNKLIQRRTFKEPIAYILKQKEFWSTPFIISKNTLIPRPETELMVEKLVNLLSGKNLNILDIGTGSGCILISLLSELKKSRGIGIDISKKAIEIAVKNASNSKLDNRIKFFQKSIIDFGQKKFDLIVSNPPYIRSRDIKNLDDDIKKYEPKIALDGGNDGLDLIKKVIYKSKYILKINGLLALEIGNKQLNKVSKILNRNYYRIEQKIFDYKNNTRCLIARNLNNYKK